MGYTSHMWRFFGAQQEMASTVDPLFAVVVWRPVGRTSLRAEPPWNENGANDAHRAEKKVYA